jgi:hypothetical protein
MYNDLRLFGRGCFFRRGELFTPALFETDISAGERGERNKFGEGDRAVDCSGQRNP